MNIMEHDTISNDPTVENIRGTQAPVHQKIGKQFTYEEAFPWEEVDVFAILRGEVAPPPQPTHVNKDEIREFQRQIQKAHENDARFSSSKCNKCLKTVKTALPMKKGLTPDFTVLQDIKERNMKSPKGSPPRSGCSVYIQVIKPDEKYIQATEGKATLSIQADEETISRFTAYLTTLDGETAHAECIYMEKIGDGANIHVICPQPGQYKVLLKHDLTEDETENVAVFLVNCTKVKDPCDRYLDIPCRYGVGPLLKKHGVSVVSQKSSTVIAPEGQCEVTFRLDHPMEYICCIFDKLGKQVDGGQIYIQVHGDLITLQTRIRTAGMYLMTVKFRERGDTKWGQKKASFLLVVPTPCELPSYSENFCCGKAWWCDLETDGLEYEGGYMSSLHVYQSKFDLRFRVKPDVTILAKLFPGDDCFFPSSHGDIAVLDITLPDPGEYTLSMIKSTQENKYMFVQYFRIKWSVRDPS